LKLSPKSERNIRSSIKLYLYVKESTRNLRPKEGVKKTKAKESIKRIQKRSSASI
jgi:hypothetical protein